MKTVVLFDIADQGFTFYTEKEWEEELEGWREELKEDLMMEWRQELKDDPMAEWRQEFVDDMNIDDLVEAIGGEEYFWDFIK